MKKLGKDKSVPVFLLLAFLAFTAAVISYYGKYNSFLMKALPDEGKKVTIRYVEGQWILNDGTVLKLMPYPSSSLNSKPYGSFFFITYSGYEKLSQEEKAKFANATIIQVINENSGKKEKIFLVSEPDLWKKTVSINGILPPGTGYEYGSYSGCTAISVTVTWNPGNQVLGIGIREEGTTSGYGYWYTGGSAGITFSVDPSKSYLIYVLSHHNNSETISYSGTIVLWFE